MLKKKKKKASKCRGCLSAKFSATPADTPAGLQCSYSYVQGQFQRYVKVIFRTQYYIGRKEESYFQQAVGERCALVDVTDLKLIWSYG